VFDRLMNAGSWDHMKLVEYLASVQSILSPDEIEDLKARSIFTRKVLTKQRSVHPKSGQSTASPSPRSAMRYLASTLYTPTESHIALGLHVIEWKVNLYIFMSYKSKKQHSSILAHLPSL